jgi:MFS family permease
MLVVTVGEMLSFPITAGFTANRSTRGNEGAYMGWYALVFAAASVLGPTIGSAIYERDADAVWMWAMGVGAAVFVGYQALAMRVEGRAIFRKRPSAYSEPVNTLSTATELMDQLTPSITVEAREAAVSSN